MSKLGMHFKEGAHAPMRRGVRQVEEVGLAAGSAGDDTHVWPRSPQQVAAKMFLKRRVSHPQGRLSSDAEMDEKMRQRNLLTPWPAATEASDRLATLPQIHSWLNERGRRRPPS